MKNYYPITFLTTVLLYLVSCGDSNSNSQPQTLLNCTIDQAKIKEYQIGDSYYPNQWHLNTHHINAYNAWQDDDLCYGKSVNIAVLDTAVDKNHQDLKNALNFEYSYDYTQNRLGTIGETQDSHGTAVAGIISSRINDYGTVGIAPLSNIISLNVLDTDIVSDIVHALATDGIIDISNNSWGSPDDTGQLIPVASQGVLDAISQGIMLGRDGKGIIYVWAAGNGGNQENANYDGYLTNRKVIAVTALTRDNLLASYSEFGSNIFISAPGGQRGCFYNTGIYTTDLIIGGYNTTVELADRYIQPDITSTFCGSSAATPMISAVIALMLEARPALTWRDVRHILAKTAIKINPHHSSWLLNGSNIDFSHYFGFGKINTIEAIALAKTWQLLPPEKNIILHTTPNVSIKTNNQQSQIFTLNTTKNISIESVKINLNTDHNYWADLNISLTSPAGTKSLLSQSHDCIGQDGCSINYEYQDLADWEFLSVLHLDENSPGTWIVEITDTGINNAGTLKNITLKLFGY